MFFCAHEFIKTAFSPHCSLSCSSSSASQTFRCQYFRRVVIHSCKFMTEKANNKQKKQVKQNTGFLPLEDYPAVPAVIALLTCYAKFTSGFCYLLWPVCYLMIKTEREFQPELSQHTQTQNHCPQTVHYGRLIASDVQQRAKRHRCTVAFLLAPSFIEAYLKIKNDPRAFDRKVFSAPTA